MLLLILSAERKYNLGKSWETLGINEMDYLVVLVLIGPYLMQINEYFVLNTNWSSHKLRFCFQQMEKKDNHIKSKLVGSVFWGGFLV